MVYSGYYNCLKFGDMIKPEIIIAFHINLPNHSNTPVVMVGCKNRSSAYKLLKKFREARKAVTSSSAGLNGGGFKEGSLRWIASHSGYIRIFDKEIKKIYFKPRCLRKILKTVNDNYYQSSGFIG